MEEEAAGLKEPRSAAFGSGSDSERPSRAGQRSASLFVWGLPPPEGGRAAGTARPWPRSPARCPGPSTRMTTSCRRLSVSGTGPRAGLWLCVRAVGGDGKGGERPSSGRSESVPLRGCGVLRCSRKAVCHLAFLSV